MLTLIGFGRFQIKAQLLVSSYILSGAQGPWSVEVGISHTTRQSLLQSTPVWEDGGCAIQNPALGKRCDPLICSRGSFFSLLLTTKPVFSLR